MAARNAKNVQKSDWMSSPPDHASALNTNYTRSQKSEILWRIDDDDKMKK